MDVIENIKKLKRNVPGHPRGGGYRLHKACDKLQRCFDGVIATHICNGTLYVGYEVKNYET